MRFLAVLLTLILLLAALFMGAYSVEVGDSPNCADPLGLLEEFEEEGLEDATCWDSDILQTATVILGWGSVAVFALAAAFAFVAALTARWRPLATRLAILGVLLGIAAVIVTVID